MPASIKPYDSQASAQGALQPMDARAPQMIDGVAQGIPALVSGLDSVAQNEISQADADARAWSLQAASTSDLRSKELYDQQTQAAKPGGAGFRDDLMKNWGDYVSKTIEEAPNQASKNYLNAHLANTTERLAAQGLDFQNKERLDWRTDQISKSIDADATLISKLSDHDDIDHAVGDALGKVNGYYQTEPMTPEMRRQLTDKARETITNAGAIRQIQLDPNMYLTRNSAARNPAVMQTDPDAPLGIRNNNPGNLRTTQFTGNVGNDKNGYAQFDSPEAGLRAMAKNLISYQDQHGINTIAGIAAKWAPAKDNNDPVMYAQTVAKDVGVGPNDKLNLKDPDVLKSTMTAMIKMENGAQPYSDEQVGAGVDAAINGTPVKVQQTSGLEDGTRVKTSSTTFNLGTWEQQQKWTALAETDKRRLNTEQKQKITETDQLLGSVKERMAAGFSLPDADRAQVDAAVTSTADAKTTKRWLDLQATQQLTDRMQKLPPAQIDQLINTQLEPLAHRDGATEREFLQLEVAQKILKANTEKAQNDPISLAASSGLNVQPVDFNKPETVTARQATAQSVGQTYGVEPKYFSSSEAKQLNEQVNNMTPDGKMAFVQRMAGSMTDPNMYRIAMEQIRPDSPVTAMAGMYANAGGSVTTAAHAFSPDESVTAQQVAKHLIDGEALINPSKIDKKQDGSTKGFPMPPETGATGLRQSFDDFVGNSFAESPQLRDQVYQGVKAYYAAESAKIGDYTGTLNNDTITKAKNAVIGSVVDKNGQKVIAPWGMDATTFNDVGKTKYDALLHENEMDRTIFNWNNVKLQTQGNGMYLVKSGQGYLSGKNGRPLVLNLGAYGPDPATPPVAEPNNFGAR